MQWTSFISFDTIVFLVSWCCLLSWYIWLYIVVFCSFGCMQGIPMFGKKRKNSLSLQQMCTFSSKTCRLERSGKMGCSHFCQMCCRERLLFQSNGTHQGQDVSQRTMHGKWLTPWPASKCSNMHSWLKVYQIQKKCAIMPQSRTCWRTSRQNL